jgi:hypothetical protein
MLRDFWKIFVVRYAVHLFLIAECQPLRDCNSAACTLASIKQWKRPICAAGTTIRTDRPELALQFGRYCSAPQ